MLLEILNASKEIYVCLYVILPLAGFTQSYPSLVKPYTEQVQGLVRKILSLPGGLDESCLLYVGHWVCALQIQGIISGEMHQQVVLMMMARLSRAHMPSTAKVKQTLINLLQSFMLPIAVSVISYGVQTLHFLMRHQLSADDFKGMLSKWLCYFPNFNDSFSKDLSRRALTQILAFSAHDIEFASIKVQPGAYSKEDMLLQVAILSLLAGDLLYDTATDKLLEEKMEDDGGEEDFEDLGDDGDDYGNYGDEDNEEDDDGNDDI